MLLGVDVMLFEHGSSSGTVEAECSPSFVARCIGTMPSDLPRVWGCCLAISLWSYNMLTVRASAIGLHSSGCKTCRFYMDTFLYRDRIVVRDVFLIKLNVTLRVRTMRVMENIRMRLL